jgi:hypothetical protein
MVDAIAVTVVYSLLAIGRQCEEAGVNPARTRHCHRGAILNRSPAGRRECWPPPRREGRGEHRSGSQETPAVRSFSTRAWLPEEGVS